ncbi:YuzD family protein [Aneurinibacillus terranovensis]|uniref:YuzD family protein n=1 Tax=Aneurinibacillus terranovensis TaxID=278991 RepID=UPI0003F569D7
MVINVFGAEQLCASCVNLPSAKDTAEWLQAALDRRYGPRIIVRYVDINGELTSEDAEFANRIHAEEFWYPLVVLNGQVIGEGNPKLKDIQQVIEREGIQAIV